MSDYAKPIGNGGLWFRETKSGDRYFSWSITFPVNANVPITVNGVAFKNDKKEGKQPDWKLIVNGWDNAKERDIKPRASPPEKANAQDEDIPF